ncbi:MAG: hypothetical protein RQ736_03870 [Thiogranum sp.]|nr:hypothetical protein [Thiogranum sp.]
MAYMNQYPKYIISAGMPRSASTWLYNAIRLVMLKQPNMANKFSSGWIGDLNKLPQKNYMLIKVHEFNDDLASASTAMFYSYRDIRDVIASVARKFGGIPSLEEAGKYIESHENWIQAADLTVKYESMLHDKESIIVDIVNALNAKQTLPFQCGEDVLNAEEIVKEIETLDFNSSGSRNIHYNEMNLYHKRHITDGRHGAWKEYLDAKLVSCITDKYQWWFEKYGYDI